MSHFSFAFGIGSQSSQGDWLEVFYPQPVLSPSADLVAAITGVLGSQLATGNHAVQIDAKHPVPVDIGNLPHRGGSSSIHNTSVIEEQVNVAKPGGCFLIQRLDGALAHRIRDDPQHRDLALFEPARRALQR